MDADTFQFTKGEQVALSAALVYVLTTPGLVPGERVPDHEAALAKIIPGVSAAEIRADAVSRETVA